MEKCNICGGNLDIKKGLNIELGNESIFYNSEVTASICLNCEHVSFIGASIKYARLIGAIRSTIISEGK